MTAPPSGGTATSAGSGVGGKKEPSGEAKPHPGAGRLGVFPTGYEQASKRFQAETFGYQCGY